MNRKNEGCTDGREKEELREAAPLTVWAGADQGKKILRRRPVGRRGDAALRGADVLLLKIFLNQPVDDGGDGHAQQHADDAGQPAAHRDGGQHQMAGSPMEEPTTLG